MPNTLPALIFDLDGTLTDSKPGIVSCLKQVLEERGIPEGGPLDRFIGPPIERWMEELMPDGSQEAHADVIRAYRACYNRTGWIDNALYPGIQAMLRDLKRLGFPLYVCTSKQFHFAVRILEEFGVAEHFVAIYGDRAEFAVHSKVLLLELLLKEQALDPEKAWMIGDRIFDIEAARVNRAQSLAAGWGYGWASEWAKANAVANTPNDVVLFFEKGAEIPAAL